MPPHVIINHHTSANLLWRTKTTLCWTLGRRQTLIPALAFPSDCLKYHHFKKHFQHHFLNFWDHQKQTKIIILASSSFCGIVIIPLVAYLSTSFPYHTKTIPTNTSIATTMIPRHSRCTCGRCVQLNKYTYTTTEDTRRLPLLYWWWVAWSYSPTHPTSHIAHHRTLHFAPLHPQFPCFSF